MLKNNVVDPHFPECPVRNILSRICNLRAMLVLLLLDGNDRTPMRHTVIRQQLPDLSQRALNSTLRELEADGLVVRQAYPEVPVRVEYGLTDRARTLLPHLRNLTEWAFEHLSEIVGDRASGRSE